AGRIECVSISSRILAHSVRYCALLPPSYDTGKSSHYPVLYYLHGLGENEQMFVSSDGWQLIEDLRDQGKIGEFLIVTPDADRTFYINSREGRTRYEDFFIREFLPYIERRYRIQPGRAHRGIAGISMGGYGALRFAFRYPQLFSSVSVHSPALLEKFPAIAVSNPRHSQVVRMMGTAFGSPPDPAYWDRNTPFALARTSRPSGLKIYLDCGTEDEYGFNAGAQQFHDLLSARGIPHEFHLYPGGHDWQYFASHLPASLEFESNAFGLSAKTK
ncbi:MAG: alpha/beta hydrolase, partial [Candidatus Acidiferrales bacterium]